MILRRRKAAPEPVTEIPVWRARLDRARDTIIAQRPPPWVTDRLESVERALVDADHDQDRIATAIAQLDPDRIARSLKDALRAQHRQVSDQGDDHRITALRRQYETVNTLLDRREAIAARIDTAVMDVELLAVRAVEIGVAPSSAAWELDDQIERLTVDIAALEQAYAETRDL